MLASHARATECEVEVVLVTPVPASAIPSWGLEALLAIVSAPEPVPAAFGSKLTLRVNDCPGSSVALEVEPLRLKPVPLIENLEIFAFALPVFLIVACSVSVVPTVILPKLNDAGLEESVTTEACPVAFHAICVGEPGALLVILISPLAAPADESFTAAVRLALCPAAIFKGVVIPETLMPEPVTLRLEIVNGESPELESRIVWLVVVPVGTVPKLTEDGVAVNAELAPVPLRLIAVGESVALLVTVTCSEYSPEAVGLKPAVSVAA